MESKEVRAVISDWDDTKVNTFESIHKLLCNFASSEQIIIPTIEELKIHWGKPTRKILEGLWSEFTDFDLLEVKFWEYDSATDFCIQPFPDTRETVLKLRNLGYTLGVVSSGPKRSMEKTIKRHLRLPNSVYEFILSGEDTPFHKPDPRVFDVAFEYLSKSDISEDLTVYVGDGLNDFKAARDRGMEFYATVTGFTTREEFLDNGLKELNVLGGFGELPIVLQNRK